MATRKKLSTVPQPTPIDTAVHSHFQALDHIQGFAKVGVMGFAGSGKSYTSALLSIGLVQFMRERELTLGDKPVYYLETEQGADWLVPMFKRADVPMLVWRTRSFTDLLTAVVEAERDSAVLLIDSITHFWKDLTESYQRKLKRTRLQFEDWNVIKPEWAKFSDRFVTSNLNIVMCGRAGWEYDYFDDPDRPGKKELEKTGIKMKAENEMGYEPSLLILMERIQDVENGRVVRQVRRAVVLKDRSDELDGKEIDDPTFTDFLPHFSLLTFDAQPAVDTSRNSESRFRSDGLPEWKWRKEQAEIALDEISEIIKKHHGGQGTADKDARAALLEEIFGTRSWKRVEMLAFEQLQVGRDALWLKLEGKPYSFQQPPASESPKAVEPTPKEVAADANPM